MANVLEYKCPNCAASLVWDGKTQKMKCNYCDSELDIEAIKQYDEILKVTENERTNTWNTYNKSENWEGKEELKDVKCDSCGGEILTDKNTIATECPYCGNPNIIYSQVSNALCPDMVIPFKIQKNEAKEELKKFYKKKPLLPKLFKKENRIDKITGIYVPFWLYDCNTKTNAIYNCKKAKTWRSGNIEYTKTDYYSLTRCCDMDFVKIPVDGSEKIDDIMMEAIEPFNYKDLVPFSMGYLSGFLADKYDVDAETNKPRVNERIRNSIDSEIRNTMRGYTIEKQIVNVNIQNGKIQYALMPIWLLNTKYKDKLYTFAMNGQTGKFIGKLPIDKGKAFGYFIGISAVAFAISVWFFTKLWVGTAMSLIAGGVSVGIMVNMMSNMRQQINASVYGKNFALTKSSDLFLYSRTTNKTI